MENSEVLEYLYGHAHDVENGGDVELAEAIRNLLAEVKP